MVNRNPRFICRMDQPQAEPFNPSRLSPDVLHEFKDISEKGVPPLDTLPTIDQRRQAYKNIGELLGGKPNTVRAVKDLFAEAKDIRIPLRLYLPEGKQGSCPVIVYFHGGGWSLGSIDTHDRVCRRLVHTSGYAVVSVGYRLAPEYPAPAGPDDAIAATRWISQNATNLGLDQSRLAIAGDSAGGGLCAAVTQNLRHEISITAQVLFYPATDLSPSSVNLPSRHENGNIPPLTLKVMEVMFAPYIGKFDSYDPRLSPALASDFHGLPPALIIVGDCDVLRDDGRSYRDALRRAGVSVEYTEVPGMVHAFIEMAGVLPASIRAFEDASSFLKNHLH